MGGMGMDYSGNSGDFSVPPPGFSGPPPNYNQNPQQSSQQQQMDQNQGMAALGKQIIFGYIILNLFSNLKVLLIIVS